MTPRIARSWRRIAIWALIGYAVLATVAAVALGIQQGHSNTALARATSAVRQATRVERQLQAEAAGECYRVNYLRWQVDLQRYAVRNAELESIRQARLGLRELPRVERALHLATSSPATRAIVRTSVAEQQTLIKRDRAIVNTETFLPLTNCAAADTHPSTYKPHTAVFFSSVPKAELRKALSEPPPPPQQGHYGP